MKTNKIQANLPKKNKKVLNYIFKQKIQIKIRTRLLITLFLVAFLILGGNAAVFYTQSLQDTDGAIIDAAGRNRMLSQRIGYYSEQVARGDKEDQEVLLEIINLHEDSFYSLKNGGVAPGIAEDRLLPPTNSNILPIVTKAEELWISYKKNAEVIATNEIYIDDQLNPKIKTALDFIEFNSSEMLDRNNEMVKAYVRMNDKKQNILNIVLYVVITIGVLLLLVISSNIRHLVKSIASLTDTSQALAKGNLLARSRIKSNDELGILSQSFNTMADNILEAQSNLETKVELRTSDLGKNKNSLEQQQLAILNILEDVKEEKQRADEQSHELKKFQLAVEKASDHIVITDIEGVVLYANEAVEKITGFTKEEIIGKKAGTKDLWGGLMGLDFYKNFWQTVKAEKKVFSGELNNKRKNGQAYVAQAHISPILDKEGEVIFFVGIERDITREKEIDRMKTEFISLASHQLRTPLSAMKWFLEMLLAGDVGKLTKEQKEMLQDVDQSNERMIALVNGLLNISRIESGRIIVDPKLTDLSLLIKEILKELEQNIKEKKLNLVVSMSEDIGEILVDQSLIREVYLNLMTNAIKYSKKNGEIVIRLSKDSENVVFQIIDDGLGIPEKDQASIFEKFHRASNAVKSETDGTGLGLYLTKAIVESSKGKIWFESEENKGTTFWFTLPLTGVVAQKGEVHLDGIKVDSSKEEVSEIKSDTKAKIEIVEKPEKISKNEVDTTIDHEENLPNVKVESLDNKNQKVQKVAQNDKKDSKVKTKPSKSNIKNKTKIKKIK